MTAPDQDHNLTPAIGHLRVLLDGIWAATSYEAVAEAAAGAVVSATRFVAARALLGRDPTEGQATATVGAWDTRSGKRWLPNAFRAKTGPDARPVRDKSGLEVGTLSTLPAPGQVVTAHERTVTGLLTAQTGLATGYIRLQDRNHRLDKDLAAARQEAHIAQRARQIAIHEAPHPIVIIGLQPKDYGQLLEANDAFAQLTGREPGDLVGTALLDLLAAEECATMAASLRRAAQGRRSPDTRQTLLTTTTGQQRRVRITTTPVLDTDERPQFAIGHIQHRADADPADQRPISAADASAIADQLTRAIKSAQRYDAPAAFLLCDLSDLDQLLHNTDPRERQQLISQLAARLGTTVRDSDVLGQLDEHTLSLLVADTHPGDAHELAARVRTALVQAAHEHGHQLAPRIGIAMIDHTSDVPTTIRNAAAAMLSARSAPTGISLHQQPVTETPDLVPAAHIIRNRRQRGGLRT